MKRFGLLFVLFFSAQAIADIKWKVIGDPGNPADNTLRSDGTSGYGDVGYRFLMAELEVTHGDMADFLNAIASIDDANSLYRTHWSASWAPWSGLDRTTFPNGTHEYSPQEHWHEKPINYVFFETAARYVNWIYNGKPTGYQDATTTEAGIYDLTQPVLSDPGPSALLRIPNEHEWHKAAFHEPGASGNGDGWWRFPTRSDLEPTPATVTETGEVNNPGENVAVYFSHSSWGGFIANLVSVGGTGSSSYYGVQDMGGNVFEWVHPDLSKPDPHNTGDYRVRGGAASNTSSHLRSTDRDLGPPDHFHNKANRTVGFRLAAAVEWLGDKDGDGVLDVDDIDLTTAAILSASSALELDMNQDGIVTLDDRVFLYGDLMGTGPGDANLDGVFDSSDLILANMSGEYEDGDNDNSTWAEGDWNGDGDYNSSDLIYALANNTYDDGSSSASAVPEPSSWFLLLAGLLFLPCHRHKR